MVETLLKPEGDNTKKKDVEENTADLRFMFSLNQNQIDSLMKLFVAKNGLLTSHVIKDKLQIGVREAKRVREVLFTIVHYNYRHNQSFESISEELLSIGCDKGKVAKFINELRAFTEESKKHSGILYYEKELFEDYLTFSGFQISTIYRILKGKDGENLVYPIVRISLRLSDTNQSKDFYIPSTNFGYFVEAINESKDVVRALIKDIKDITSPDAIVLDGDI
jgi:hypothetical protein